MLLTWTLKIRAALCIALAALQLGIAWNLLAAQIAPSLQLTVGKRLAGVTTEPPLIWKWDAARDGSLQKAIATRVTQAWPIRPFLIRLDNQIRYSLFREVTPTLFVGRDDSLIERKYLDDYCARTEEMPAAFAARVLPDLRVIQDYYRARGRIFLYVVTPSKMAYAPESFSNFSPCASTAHARENLLPRYIELLKAGGINIVDAATLIYTARARFDFDLFPKGGVHWNDVGVAEAVSTIVTEINRQAGRELVPPFSYRFKLTNVGDGTDRDLVELLNVLVPPVDYRVPKVTFQPSASCADHPARLLNAFIIGSSFNHLPTEVLISQNCLARLTLYYYMTTAEFGGNPYRQLKGRMDESELRRLRDASIVIIEDNESYIARAGYAERLRKMLAP